METSQPIKIAGLGLESEQARNHYVYGLYQGGHNLPCYIGLGKGVRATLSTRRMARLGVIAVHRKLLWNMTVYEAKDVERALIAHYGRRDLETGCLLNKTSGGQGVPDLSPATRAKLSAAQLGKKHLPETRAKISASKRGSKHAPEAKAVKSDVMRRRWATPCAREKQSESVRLIRRTPESRAKTSRASQLRFAIPGEREKVSASMRSIWAARKAAGWTGWI